MRILCKMDPDQILREISYKITAGGPINKFAEFSSFGETTFLWEWNSILSLKIWKKFTKDFHVKKNSHGNSL